MPFTTPARFAASSFSLFKRSLMQNDALPMSEIIDDQRFADAFEEHGLDFGQGEDAVYTPAITLWGLISQVFYSGEQRSTKAAVTRIGSLWATLGRVVCSSNNGASCKARRKITDVVVRRITTRIAEAAEQYVLDDQDESAQAEPPENAPEHLRTLQSGPVGGRLILVDGFTVTAADTEENQAEYPQNPAQKAGLGFPILRCVTLTSLATGMLIDLAHGPYCGKETGETALLWRLLPALQPGDVLIADRYYCTYWILAACKQRGVEVVMRNHHKRDDAPIGAKPLSKYERIATWDRPDQPEWMSAAEYAQLPTSLSLRLVDVHVDRPGYRAERFTVTTTILDSGLYTREWIAAAYGGRWMVELDIRSIKCSLGMDILRAKTPEMVRTELWSCLLAYNLIRHKVLQTAVAEGRSPRSISFTAALQLLATNWLLCAVIGVTDELAQLQRETVLSEKVGHRPRRVEPRANKRRPKILALLTQPRQAAIAELLTAASA